MVLVLLVPLLMAALVTSAHGAARGNAGLTINDASGDGRPDIKRVSVDGAGPSAARIKVRVGNVRSAVNNAPYPYVDPTGERARPSYGFVLGTINSASIWYSAPAARRSASGPPRARRD